MYMYLYVYVCVYVYDCNLLAAHHLCDSLYPFITQATTVVPRAMLSGVGVVFLLSFVLAFSVSSLAGVSQVQDSLAPMNYGFASMFHIPAPAATVFSLFAVFSVGLGYMFSFSRHIMALARSTLCPVCLKHTWNGAPVGKKYCHIHTYTHTYYIYIYTH
jgi:amino acid transporter